MPSTVATTGAKYVTEAAVVAPFTRTTFQNRTYAKLVPNTPSPTSPHNATELSAKAPSLGAGSMSANGSTRGIDRAI